MSKKEVLSPELRAKINRFVQVWHESGRRSFEKNYQNLKYDEHEAKRAIERSKFVALDNGSSGVFLVEKSSGKVYGIKAYGVPNLSKFHGSIDSLSNRYEESVPASWSPDVFYDAFVELEKSKSVSVNEKVREDLKASFPGVNFSVKKGSSHGSVSVSYVDGPPKDAVKRVLEKYVDGYFDGMSDSYEYFHDGREGGLLYLDVSRDLSMLEAVQAQMIADGMAKEGWDHYGAEKQSRLLFENVDLQKGYHGIRRNNHMSGGAACYCDVIQDDSPVSPPDVCKQCDSELSGAGVCAFCKAKAAEEAAYQEQRRAYKMQLAEAKRILSGVEAFPVDYSSLVMAKFPKLNKQCNLADYDKQIEPGEYNEIPVKIEYQIILDDQQFAALSVNLMEDFGFFNGKGGNRCGIDFCGREFYQLSDMEQEQARNASYSLGVLVSSPSRSIVVDPQGYGYARYVGIV